ncbi:hypothetical protein ACHAWF_017572, partial [Thalassiosira exigua]
RPLVKNPFPRLPPIRTEALHFLLQLGQVLAGLRQPSGDLAASQLQRPEVSLCLLHLGAVPIDLFLDLRANTFRNLNNYVSFPLLFLVFVLVGDCFGILLL